MSLNQNAIPQVITPGLSCDTCKIQITYVNYIQCYKCDRKFHFSPCTLLSEATWNTMSAIRKTEWKCQHCKPRSRSPNNVYQSVISGESQKYAREIDETEEDEINANKRKKEKPISSSNNATQSPTTNTKNNNNNINIQQSEFASFKDDMRELKTTMQQLAMSLQKSHKEIKEELSKNLTKINETLEHLTSQVNDLKFKDKQREQQIFEMDKRIHQLEQQAINKNIEITNIYDEESDGVDVIKRIASLVETDITENDIVDTHRIKNKNTLIAQFVPLAKKELMSKIKKRRFVATDLNVNKNNTEHKYIYINEELTANNRLLLWISKIKARECGWKFVWTRNRHTFAKKSETASAIHTSNTADIETVTRK